MTLDPHPERPILAIVGPTGAGKSNLSLHVAQAFRGEIINCDSLQLYRGFDVGTAKPTLAERLTVPHHMFDVLDPQQGYSAGEYARHARGVIGEISARGSLPVIAGGTGFYLKALLCGLPNLPERDLKIRGNLATRERRRPGALHRILQRLDPGAASRIHSNDVHKLTRALEIRLLTQAPLPPATDAEPLRGYRIIEIGLDPNREQLYKSLDERTVRMFRCGLIEEVQGLLERGCSGSEKPFESLGYKQVIQYLDGTLCLDEAVSSTQLQTRQYAKRQLTWFRRDRQVNWVSGFGHSPFIIEQCLELIHSKL